LHAATKNQTQVRVISGLTHLFPTPQVIADADVASIGLPAARAESIRSLARAVSSKEIAFTGVIDATEFRRQLCELPGIGAWTAEYIAMRALRDPDAFPPSDLGLLKAATMRSPRELEARAEAWRPWRAYASMYLWGGLGNSVTRSLVRAAGSAVGSAVKSEGTAPGEKHAAHVRTA